MAVSGKFFSWSFLPNQYSLLRLTGFMEKWPCWLGGEKEVSKIRGKERERAQTELWWGFDPKRHFSIQIHSEKVLGRFCFHSNIGKISILQHSKLSWSGTAVLQPALNASLMDLLNFVLTAQVQSWQGSTVISELPQANTWLKMRLRPSALRFSPIHGTC